jgi:hypothetical protein
VIASVPSYGYSYYDSYCGIEFPSLELYDVHCLRHHHPEAILVVDARSRAPLGTCIYDSGRWVVDDCGDSGHGYADGRGDGYRDDRYRDEGDREGDRDEYRDDDRGDRDRDGYRDDRYQDRDDDGDDDGDDEDDGYDDGR